MFKTFTAKKIAAKFGRIFGHELEELSHILTVCTEVMLEGVGNDHSVPGEQ